MLINNKHIREYRATLLDRNISTNRVTTNYNWDYTLDRPSFFGNALEFKDVLLYFKVDCSTENEFHLIMARMAEEFRKGATVKFSDLSCTYTMYLKQKPEYTKLNPTTYRLDFVLDSDYGLSQKRVVESNSSTISVVNKGLFSTPAKLWLTVPALQSKLTITGFDHTIEILNTPMNAEICIDGINGVLTINGENAMSKLNTFHLPKLVSGKSIISVDEPCNMTLEYYERY